MIVRNMQISGKPNVPNGVGTLLVSLSPFSQDDLRRVEETARTLKFDVALSPEHSIDDTFSQLASGRDLEAVTDSVSAQHRPAHRRQPVFLPDAAPGATSTRGVDSTRASRRTT